MRKTNTLAWLFIITSSMGYSQFSKESSIRIPAAISIANGLSPTISKITDAKASVVAILAYDASAFQTNWYIQFVQNKIASKWVTESQPYGFIKISFSISHDGTISGIKRLPVEKANIALEQSVTEAIQNTNVLPHLPNSYSGASIELTICFSIVEVANSNK